MQISEGDKLVDTKGVNHYVMGVFRDVVWISNYGIPAVASPQTQILTKEEINTQGFIAQRSAERNMGKA